jgi:hypothetical protein
VAFPGLRTSGGVFADQGVMVLGSAAPCADIHVDTVTGLHVPVVAVQAAVSNLKPFPQIKHMSH